MGNPSRGFVVKSAMKVSLIRTVAWAACCLCFSLISLCSLSCSAQTTSKSAPDPSILYPFEDYFINLETREKVIPKVTPTENFKTSSVYAFRFSQPHWWLHARKSIRFPEAIFEIDAEGGLLYQSTQGKGAKKKLPGPKAVSGQQFLIKFPDGVVYIQSVGNPAAYLLFKYDKMGTLIWEEPLAFEPSGDNTDPPYDPALQYFYRATEGYLVFTTRYDGTGTTLIDQKDGRKGAFGFEINGIIRGTKESEIDGFLQLDGEQKTLKANFLSWDWTVPCKEADFVNNTETIRAKDMLIVASWHDISTGSWLVAYDIQTGAVRWRAEVDQLQAEHSKYFNAVTLSRYKDTIIMEGTEAYGNYLQIFDLKSGERLYNSLNGLK